jgi:DNA-binding response OmpR family regulator
MKILIAEDDLRTREGLCAIFDAEGYEVVTACDGDEALARFTADRPDVVCLDIMMPGKSGYEVCREIRRHDESVPVLFISAKSEEIDKVLGLEIGADDYIVKPFGVREVAARVRALIRRSKRRQGATVEGAAAVAFTMDDLRIVPDELRAYRGDTSIELSPRDVSILTLLNENTGKVCSRDHIFDVCWGLNYCPNSRSLDQHISQLRRRIERDPHAPTIVRTVHGAGYRYETTV